jgi:integrase
MSDKEARLAETKFKMEDNSKNQDTVKFRTLADNWLDTFRPSNTPTVIERKNNLLEKYILPGLGEYKLADISPKMILTEVIRPIEEIGKFPTARMVNQHVSSIFKYAMSIGEATKDPTAELVGSLIPARCKPSAAITKPAEVGRLMYDIASYSRSVSVTFALRIIPYVFVRPGELRNAEWEEFDLNARLWRIPASKMNMSTNHLVPLSRQVLGLLKELKIHIDRGKYLFPGRDNSKPISNMALNTALKSLGYSNTQMCPDGFRVTASTLLNMLGYNSDWIERQLGRSERSVIREAKDHDDYLAERTTMMQEWADYLDGLLSDYRQSNKL